MIMDGCSGMHRLRTADARAVPIAWVY